MKTIKKTLPILLLLAITSVISSCSSDDGSTETENQSEYYMTAKVNGQEYSANQDAIVTNFTGIVDGTDIRGVYQIDIDNYEHIRFDLIEYDNSLGTFDLTSGNNSMTYQINSKAWAAHNTIGSGSVTITVNDTTHIEGTFSGTLIDVTDDTTKVITEGNFSAIKQ